MSLTQHSLSDLNSFGLDASCREFYRFSCEAKLSDWLRNRNLSDDELLVLGGGSNLLLLGHIDKVFIQPAIAGICYQEKGDDVLVTAGAGVNWHDLVLDSLQQGYAGLENLALIPGTVGAAPIQNIGAYGVELKDRFVSLEAIRRNDGKKVTFSKEQCQFGYRNSVFKTTYKNQFVITKVTLSLCSKNAAQHLNIDYGAIGDQLAESGYGEINSGKKITPKAVAEAVIAIRQSKLPDPSELGNAGSFFKNPVVTKEQYQIIKKEHPNLVAYELAHGDYKLAAGWLIDQAGLKGFREGDAGVHKQQALVLVNYGNATGLDILALARKVQSVIFDKFHVALEPEVWIVGDQGTGK